MFSIHYFSKIILFNQSMKILILYVLTLFPLKVGFQQDLVNIPKEEMFKTSIVDSQYLYVYKHEF